MTCHEFLEQPSEHAEIYAAIRRCNKRAVKALLKTKALQDANAELLERVGTLEQQIQASAKLPEGYELDISRVKAMREW